ncbi:MAG: hypothetical protein MJZ55_00145 [Paludibacteraceae bacterium]|nr:hypothetical protein [Paludibacteraceae bacterium]
MKPIVKVPPVLVDLIVDANGTYTKPAGADGYDSVIVDVRPNLTSLAVDTNGAYSAADFGYDGFSGVMVDVPTSGDLPEEAYELPSDCSNMFSSNHWAWYLDNYYSRAHFENNELRDGTNMFANCYRETIPNTASPVEVRYNIGSMFHSGHILKNLPTNMAFKQVSGCYGTFYGCPQLRYIPDNFFSGWTLECESYQQANWIFCDCRSLRRIPNGFFEGWVSVPSEGYEPDAYSYYYGSPYYGLAQNCSSIDEIVDIPVMGKYRDNAFDGVASYTWRLKRFTFKPNQTAQWVNQNLRFNEITGFVPDVSQFAQFNHGIDIQTKYVHDDASYATLKNDVDWFTTEIDYARYNHDSAVETINSLPDCSTFCAQEGGTNTILFYGGQGARTDGGAISELTPDEIAVAAVKGWTVTFA